jgi:hypothetical protein
MKALHFLFLATLAATTRAERINHEGRVLPDLPVVTTPLLFHTPEADAVISAMQIFPRDNAWNERIDTRPLLSNSAAMITQITNDLASNRRTLRPFYEMNYVLVPDSQPTRSIRFFEYPDESDLDGGTFPNGLYPIPDNLPIETWPRETGSLTLDEWQRDVNDEGGDRHSIMVKPGAGFVWETWLTKKVNNAWEAANGAKFNLNSNALRPAGWTSADAAGLSMFAGLVRYDECSRGMVEHAIRIIVAKTRRAYIYPATHFASSETGTNYPRMGERLRLKASFTIPDTWTIQEKAVCRALKKYGAIVADNGNFFSISVAPDPRFPNNAFGNLSTIGIGQFEVVQTTGETQGPRSPGAPSVHAGNDQFITWPASVTLPGTVTDPDAPQTPVTVQWKKYDGPGNATFANASQAQTTATFSLPGRYTLMLSGDDGVHAVAYDAVVVHAQIPTEILRSGNDSIVRFPSVSGRLYRVERSADLTPASWVVLADNIAGTGNPVQVSHSGAISLGRQFYRVSVLP